MCDEDVSQGVWHSADFLVTSEGMASSSSARTQSQISFGFKLWRAAICLCFIFKINCHTVPFLCVLVLTYSSHALLEFWLILVNLLTMGGPAGIAQSNLLWLKNQGCRAENCQLNSNCSHCFGILTISLRAVRIQQLTWEIHPSTLFSVDGGIKSIFSFNPLGRSTEI